MYLIYYPKYWDRESSANSEDLNQIPLFPSYLAFFRDNSGSEYIMGENISCSQN